MKQSEQDRTLTTAGAPLAIIGIGCLFPKSEDKAAYWATIREGVDAITEIPASHWRVDDLYDPNPKTPDKTYGKRGGFLSEVPFNPMEYNIPPNSLEAIDTSQLLGLVAAGQALQDAGYGSDKQFDRSKVSVILGVTGALEMVIPLGARLGHPRWREALHDAGVTPDVAEDVVQRISDSYVGWQENSFPGLLGNVVAGRISKQYDLGGTNCVVDAACASSFSALHLAGMELTTGAADMVVTGGVDTFNDIFMYTCFSKTPALSASGNAKPFDVSADGTILGEGLGLVVLKRLADAERDGDKIYAVVRGIGSSSDGKGEAIYTPSASGQKKAILNACTNAGVTLDSIGLLETHGTGTKVGDAVEVSAAREIFGEADQPWCAISSVKSQIGHAKAAAGSAGLIKAALALHHRVIPPTIKVTKPLDEVSAGRTPFYITTRKRPWITRNNSPRRAGVSAFGFGGSNFHTILEEYRPLQEAAEWDGSVQLLTFCGADAAGLTAQLASISADSAWNDLRGKAAGLRAGFDPKAACRLALTVERSSNLGTLLNTAQTMLAKQPGANWTTPDGICYATGAADAQPGLLFPGQGAQYVGMLRDLACAFPQLLDSLEQAETTTPGLTDLIYPADRFEQGSAEQQETELRATQIAQPAIGAVSLGALRLLEAFGLKAAAAGGHSYGELTALCAAGLLDETSFHSLSRLRGSLMAAGSGDKGSMLAVSAPLAAVEQMLAEEKINLVIANRNAPTQAVLSGATDQIKLAEAACKSRKLTCKQLPVAAAFHSPLVADAAAPFLAGLADIRWGSGSMPVYANSSAAPYPVETAAAKELLAGQLARPVEFVAQIEAMYAAGIRCFVEVGPGARLSGLVKAILGGKEHSCVALDSSNGKRNGLVDLGRCLAQLSVLGLEINLQLWDEGYHAPAAPAKKPLLVVPLCGANYVKPKPKRPAIAPKPVSAAQPAASSIPVVSAPITVQTTAPTASRDALAESLRVTREGMAVLQRMQEETAQLHRRFLEGQETASRTIQTLLSQQQQVLQGGMAIMPAMPFAPVTTAAPVTPAPAVQPQPVQAQVIAQPAPVAAQPVSNAVTETLLAVISEKTGYPMEMLELSMSMDADLGIDSIKRVEILSCLQERLPSAPVIGPDQLGVLNTLGQIAEYLGAGAAVAAPVAAPVQQLSSAITETMLAVVSEKTGYPIEMLELSMSMDADLGIDSIKRVEILSALQERLPSAPVIGPDQLGVLNTLGQIAEYLGAGAAVVAPAAVSGSQPASSAITETMLSVVSEKTGYPIEMLELSMSMDADLGIDSIKRVEILSCLQERLPTAPVIGPDQLGVLNTLGQIADYLGAGAAPTAAVAPAVSTAQPAASNITETMLTVVSDKTGYPIEMLELTMSMDADLGIDSIKRVEILSCLQERLPTAPVIGPDQLGVLNTLGQIADYLSAGTAAAAPAAPAPAATPVQPAAAAAPPQTVLNRSRIQAMPVAGGSDTISLAQNGVIVVTDDGSSFSAELCSCLTSQGHGVILTKVLDILELLPMDQVAGLVLVAPADGTDDAFLKNGFQLLKQMAPGLKRASREGGALLATVSRLDGAFGCAEGSQLIDPLSGGLAGMSKTARHEWPEVACKAIDLGIFPDQSAAAQAVANELFLNGPIEVGLSAEQRISLTLQDLPELATVATTPVQPGELVVITGGGRGVTASAAVAMAKAWQPLLVLLGRSPLPEQEPDWLQGMTDEAAIKRAILTHATEKLHPREIEERYQATVAGRELRETMAQIQAVGGRSLYCSVDIRDSQAVADLLADLRKEHGQIRGLVHGAGVLADRLIVDKTREQFNQVYSTKVAGLRSLLDATRADDLRFIALFGSTTGRLGRSGQVDYAVANEVLNKLAQAEARRRTNCRSLCLNWGPWDGGMVTPALKKVFATEGIGLIPLEAGADLLVQEIAAPTGPVEVTVLAGVKGASLSIDAPKPAAPLKEALRLTLNVDDFPFISSHVIDNKAVLPMAMIVEWLAHAALHGNPGFRFHGFNDLRICKGVIIDRSTPCTLQLMAGKAKRQDAFYTVPVELVSSLGEGRSLLHARAEIVLANKLPEGIRTIKELPSSPYNQSSAVYDQPYLFHGPDLHGIEQVIGCSDKGIAALVKAAPQPGNWIKQPLRSNWLTDPLVVDSAFQMMILWSFEQFGAGSLPSFAGRYRQFHETFPKDGAQVVIRVTSQQSHSAVADVEFLERANGKLIARLEGYECVIDASLQQAFQRNQLPQAGQSAAPGSGLMQDYSSTVAIVGIGALFPDAPDLAQYWELIRSGRSAVREVPPGRWQVTPEEIFDPEVGKQDHLYTTRGCFLDQTPHLPELDGLDPLFHLLVSAGRKAFSDCQTADLDRSRVGVIIGNLALPSETSSLLARNWLGRSFEEQVVGAASEPVPTSPLNRYLAGLPAGILAQQLGLGGLTNTLDAACASSLYAIKLAMDELLSGRADAMLTGGLSRPDPLYTQMGFSQLRALSKRGICSPFDAAGDGLLTGEGAGIFVLKRTSDAVASGDRIYGIIRAVGLSNDVGGSLLAPMSEGQLRAMQAAYLRAGWQPQDVDLIECHATGTPVGDAVEVASLKELWQGSDAQQSCVIGSVKSNIGHLLTAAGAAALTKVLLAMQHATLPPTANFRSPQPGMQLEQSPFKVLTQAEPWQRRGDTTPRRAAVSAFGFGGINAHLLVEEYMPSVGAYGHTSLQPPPTSVPIAIVGMDASFGPWQGLQAVQQRVLGGSSNALAPTRPNKRWWGVEQRAWFKQQGLDQTPFTGWFMDQVKVGSTRFRIPPKEMEEMQPQQLLMLQTAANALQDAGLDKQDNPGTGVMIGIAFDLNSTGFSLRWPMQQQARVWADKLGRKLTETELPDWTAKLRDSISPALNANRTMGSLGNIVASRIAREFKIGGPSFTLSSEESSGIRALETAVRMLQLRELDQAVVGAVDLAGDLRAVLGQHAVHPFSGTGQCRPFDCAADGTVIGEGACAFVLKRLSDAEADGNRIYAVIRGIGSSNGTPPSPPPESGGGISLSALNQGGASPLFSPPSLGGAGGGYASALQRAYQDSGIAPATVSLLEAAADASPEQDRLEAEELTRFFADSPTDATVVGSVKGAIGHTGAVSGLASLLRGCLALYQEIIPASTGTETACPELTNGPLQLVTTPRYWLRNREEGPRRAGVSVCGIDGSCSHVVLEGWDRQSAADAVRRQAPLGPCHELLFPLVANSSAELSAELDLLQQRCRATAGSRQELAGLASEYCSRITLQSAQPQGMALVAADAEQLEQLIEQGRQALQQDTESVEISPSLRERLFYSREPLANQGRIAFVFPGSGNHYPAMARDLFCCWPGILRQQDKENRWLKNQFQPDLFWSGKESTQINDNHRAVIFGQVAVGCGVSDLVRNFGISPTSVIGYSLGESAALFSTRTWVDRDLMYSRMQESTLFTHDLAGECRAARTAWGLADDQQVNWSLGVVMAPADQVRAQISALSWVYLLIINTPDECVVGGDSTAVNELVSRLGCHFFPLYGVTTVHCEVAQPVATPYHDLHLFTTNPPQGVTFYSGAKGDRFEPTRENCAAAILDQALQGIDYPATIEAAYRDGVRLFLEMGPGNSCSRMISRILEGRPHLARSACFNGQDQVLTLLRLLASLIAERVPLDLSPLCMAEPLATQVTSNSPQVRLVVGGKPFTIPTLPPVASAPPQPPVSTDSAPQPAPPLQATVQQQSSTDTLLQEFSQAQAAQIAAHEAFLTLSNSLTQSMAQALALQANLQQALGDDAPPADQHLYQQQPLQRPTTIESPCAFNREMCMEFAIGKVSTMLGPQFAELDSFPTRVRLPDEPLMLVDRIIRVEGEPRSMTNGRVITEHDIFPHAWYLDGGRIPTCIAVEAGQADLFLSGYLGIDFITRGLAVYRLLDAVVTFHRGLPGPGETINYDIRIERFFRQGDTWLFRFFFEATVGGEPLLSMRDGCAGFFSSAALEAGKGIVRPLVDPRPTTGIRPADWQDLAPLKREGFTAEQLDKLRQGDLAGCFGSLFSGLAIKQPLTIPGNRMRLVHRVNEIIPHGGRYGQGMIRAEADIHPDDWFITCHFVDDRVMPGTLMYECCMHTLRILLLRIGWVAEANSAVWEPVPGVASKLCCRGQVLETTKVVTYEVTIREIGYRPEPYVIVDALMYADGKPIVEITSMSARLTGTSRQQLEQLWQRRNSSPVSYIKPAVYTKKQILAYSNGNPSEGFGDRYQVFDQQRKIARLPGPPFQFMDRVTAVTGEPWQMKAGAAAEAQYDLPVDAWFFGVERQPRMPFCVLLEAALQPCGWLAAYVGSALTTPNDISFRNLGGSAIQHRPVTPDSGTLTCCATMTKVATSGGMIIQEFDFSVADSLGLIYEGQTMFGFFSKEALAQQVGIRDAQPYQPSEAEIGRGRSLDYPTNAPFPEKQLQMIDQIELYVVDGGPAGLGYLQGIKQVDPDEWFFKAHFYEDPVTPGSLGLESFQQLLKFAVVERWGWQEGTIISSVALQQKHRWLYRGQVVPSNKQVRVTAWITAVDDQQQLMTASGFLAVDGKLIYQMIDFTVRMEQAMRDADGL